VNIFHQPPRIIFLLTSLYICDFLMTDPAKDAASVIELLTRYSFDLSGYTVDRLVEYWLQRYPSQWVRLGVIEALYQGRYKVISVEQILVLWRRRGKPVYHFNPDFERIVTPRFIKGVAIAPELVVVPPEPPEPPEPPAPLVEDLPMERPPLPPRLPGAIQPFSVDGMPLPREARFREVGMEPEAVEVSPIEPRPMAEPEPLAEAVAEPAEEPAEEPIVYFPEPPNVEFKPTPDPAIGELPIQPFQPSTDQGLPELDGGRQPDRAITSAGHQPIHHFVPMSEPSEFYAKLKAVIQNAAAAKLAKGAEEPKNNPHGSQ
jgi:hypothetical protein